MDSVFYRKVRKRLAVKEGLGKLLANKRLVIRSLLGMGFLMYVLFGSHGIVQRVRLQNEREELLAKIQQAEAETRRLQAESKALDGDPKAIEKVAREKYGMIREGETVYKVNRK